MIYSKTQKPIVILLTYSWNVYIFMSVAQREVLEYSKLLSEPVWPGFLLICILPP